MKNFVSLRVRKLHEWGSGSTNNGKKIRGVEGLTAHDLRLISTPNADPERIQLNPICCEETGWKPVPLTTEVVKEIGANRNDVFSKKAKDRIEKLAIVDNNPKSCKVANLMLMVSPQWLREGSEAFPLNEEKAAKWIESANDFLREEFGENFLGSVAHLDELNPHLSAYVLPAVKKNRKRRGPNSKRIQRKSKESWGLDSKSMFTPDQRIIDPEDPEKKRTIRIPETGTCSQLQTKFAAFCQKNGLDVVRGIVGSRSKYKEIEEYNHLLRMQTLAREEVEQIADVELLRRLVIAGQMKAEEFDRLSKDLEKIQNQMAEEQKPLLIANAILSKEKDALAGENKRLADELMRKTRAVPVGELIKKLTGVEGRPSENGKEVYVLHNGMRLEVELESNKFRNLTPDVRGMGGMEKKAGGNGGIDLAIYVTGCTPDAAKTLIADLFSIDAAAATVAKAIEEEPTTPEREALASTRKTISAQLRKADESTWPTVLQTLVEQLNLDEEHLKTLKNQRLIYSNAEGHLITNRLQIISLAEEKITGTTIQDPGNPEGFYFETGGGRAIIERAPGAKVTVVVDDPLEALALQSHQKITGTKRHIVAIGRQRSEITVLYLRTLAKARTVIVAAARTEIGRKFVEWVKSIIPNISEIAPPKGWNTWGEYNRRPDDKEITEDAKEPSHLAIAPEDYGT